MNEINTDLTRLRDLTTRELGFGQLAETARANRVRESQNLVAMGETHRSNIERERQNLMSLSEQQRSNIAKELESHRSNVAREEISRQQQDETVRSNLARESESYRHNVQSELAAFQSAASRVEAAKLKLYGDMERISLGYSQLAESVRSNLARESETQRANMAKESETRRSNVTREQETHRSNVVSEANKSRELDQKALSIGFEGARTVGSVVKDFSQAAANVFRIVSAVSMGG